MNQLGHHLDDQFLVRAHRRLLMPCIIEERMTVLLRQGHISKWFSGIGQEAVSVGAVLALDDDDYILPTHRNLGIFTTRDVDLDKLFSAIGTKRWIYPRSRPPLWRPQPSNRRYDQPSGLVLPVACGLGLAGKWTATGALLLLAW